MINMQLEVGTFKPEDESDILSLNLAEYGPTHVIITPEGFHWRCYANPAGEAEITVVRDVDTRRVIGFSWMIPVQMRLYGVDHIAVMTANQLVHPDYRESLAYPKLLRHRLQLLYKKGIPFRFNFPIENLYERTAPIEKTSSFLIPLLIRPMDFSQLIQFRYGQKWFVNPLVGLGRIIEKFYSFLVFKPSSDSIQVNWLDKFDQHFDAFWLRVRNKYSIMTVRDQKFLSWRFSAVDDREYKLLGAFKNGVMIGYAIIRKTNEIRGISTGLIMDFLVEEGPDGDKASLLLLEKIRCYFQKENVALTGGIFFQHTQEYRNLRQAGYFPVPRFLAPRLFRVAFNCFNQSFPPTNKVRREDWFLSIADYEAH
jgi:hypothetical protein